MSTRLVVSKPTFNAITESNPYNLIYSSEYNTLKYFVKGNVVAELDDSNGSFLSTQAIFSHNLGYYPKVEVYVRVYIGSPSGNYEPAPFSGSGASVFYGATYRVTSTNLYLYGFISGFSFSVWEFDFIYFIYKNNTGL